MNIEQLLSKLDIIVQQMEKGSSIEDSLKLFDEGVTITQECFKKLDEYKGKLAVIKTKLDSIDNNE